MAPEQMLGQSIDEHADIFALGVLVAEVVTGDRPFSANPLMRATEIGRGLRAGAFGDRRLRDIIARFLDEKPARRYASQNLFSGADVDLCADGRGISASCSLPGFWKVIVACATGTVGPAIEAFCNTRTFIPSLAKATTGTIPLRMSKPRSCRAYRGGSCSTTLGPTQDADAPDRAPQCRPCSSPGP
jgi:serine/threonine protein kinase